MAEVKWIKLVTDVFDNRKIKMIELMPEGDTILVIWFKLLCLAGTINDNGELYITKEIAFNEKTLAGYLNRPVMVVELALKTFQDFGMIEIVDDFICLPNWEKYQNVEGLEKIRNQTAERVRKHRERKRMENEKAVTMLPDVTERYPEIEIEIEKDIDIEKEVKKKKREPRHRHGEYNHILLTDKQYEKLVQDFTEPVIADVIKRMDEWCQMQGRSYKDYNLAIRKWLKGGPANKTVTHVKQSEFTNYEQRDVDYNKLEKDLLGWDDE